MSEVNRVLAAARRTRLEQRRGRWVITDSATPPSPRVVDELLRDGRLRSTGGTYRCLLVIPEPLNEGQRGEAKRMWVDGKTLREIADQFGCSLYDLSPWIYADDLRAIEIQRLGERIS